MSANTTIEWTHVPGYRGASWNPVVGCTKVSQGCKHCYAETLHDRRHKGYLAGKLQNIPQYAHPFRKVQLMPQRLQIPLKTKAPTCWFVNSMSDLFHEEVPFSFIDQVMAVMALCPQHIFIILTKRTERMAEYMNRASVFNAYATPNPIGADDRTATTVAMPTQVRLPLPNVWLGTSVEDQKTADERIPHLLRCPAAVRFLSCEPLLGAADLFDVHTSNGQLAPLAGFISRRDEERFMKHYDAPRLHWVIVGGESEPGARPMHPDWARSLRDQCDAAGVPFFFKQWGEWLPIDEPWKHGDPQPCALNERWMNNEGGFGFHGMNVWRMRKMGKAKAGRHLDGMEHNGWPEVVAKHAVES